jgi:hypothetical protein
MDPMYRIDTPGDCVSCLDLPRDCELESLYLTSSGIIWSERFVVRVRVQITYLCKAARALTVFLMWIKEVHVSRPA